MNYLGRVIGNLKGLYSGINGATLTGAIDVVIVEQEDGTFKCSPFHVRFGKLGVLRSREKVVDIELNGVPTPIRMKLGDSGEAFFVQEADEDDDFYDENLATSPLPASPQLSDSDSSRRKREDTEESTDDNRVEDSKQNVTLDDNGNTLIIDGLDDLLVGDDDDSPSESPKTETQLGVKADESKNRKRRRKRRRNQGSKSNIVIDPSTDDNDEPTEDSQEGIFKMDEELHGITEALQKIEGLSHRNYHRGFYSDTEVDVTSTPNNSRPSTPIQSDSEYEFSKIHENDGLNDVGKWPWGELPLPSTGTVQPIDNINTSSALPVPESSILGSTAKLNINSDKKLSSSYDERMSTAGQTENSKSVLGSMFSFMTKRHASGNVVGDSGSGIYLEDLNLEKMDPEVAALYFPNFGRDAKSSPKYEKDEDVESGKGSSIAQSPTSGSPPKTTLPIEIYMDEQRRQNEVKSSTSRTPKFEAISICGSNLALFEQSQLTFDELAENPEMILNAPPESIVVKLDGKFVPWSAALPQLLSTTFFQRPLPSQLHERLMNHTSQPISRSNSVSSGTARRGYSWFPWRRSATSGGDVEQPMSQSLSNFSSSPVVVKTMSKDDSSPLVHGGMAINGGTMNHLRKESSTSSSDESESGGGIRRTVQSSPSHKPIPPPLVSGATSINIGSEKYKKSLRLTSDQIAGLGLQYGHNEATFSVTTAYQGTTVARCHIYLWRFDDRVVVSDIDGTITKSDVLGHILPIIGNDWAQSGVAQLFTQIQDNGYKMLYLSARAIGQAATTRDYLRSIKQDDVTLPDGPLLLNPTSLMSAFHREVIEKKPEEFKIACLRDIETLFPTNPFYAGYGNKINDVWAYRAVGIAIPRIFTINHKGELRHALTNTFQSSYTSLVELAEFIFPAYKTMQKISLIEEETEKEGLTHVTFSTTDGFSSFEFWRDPVPELPALSDNNNSWPTAVAIAS